MAWLVMGSPAGMKVAGAPPLSERAGLESRPEGGWIRLKAHPERQPEAVEMLLAILRGSRMETSRGWFHPSQSRYDWSWLAACCDVNQDGWVTSQEFAGPAELFGRLDRDENGLITAGDLDWSDPPPLFDESFDLPQPWWNRVRTSPDEPSMGRLLSSWLKGELGSFREGPGLGEPAPDFSLRVIDSQERIGLSQHRSRRPVVLIFGNMTCGPFRSQVANLEKLAARYGDRAAFLAIYVREAHPVDGWRLPSNDRAGIVLEQPRAWTERMTVAAHCSTALRMSIPLAVDELDNRVGHAYSGMPTRLYLIDREGRVAYKAGRGPFGLKPGELEQTLVMLLMDEAAAATRQRVRTSLGSAWAAWQRWSASERGAGPPIPAWTRALSARLARAVTTMVPIPWAHQTPDARDLKLVTAGSGSGVAPRTAHVPTPSGDLGAGK